MSRKSFTGIDSYSKFPFILNNHAVLFFFLELSNNCRDLSHFVNRLPVATESKNKIYKILMNIIRNPSSTNDALEELKGIEIIPMVQDANQPLPDELQNDIQLKLNDIIDKCWFMISDGAKMIEFYEVSQQIRELFNRIFRILTQQQKEIIQQRKEIDHLKIQVDALQIPKDEILLGSLAVQLIVKMRRYTNINESPTIAAFVTPSMLLAQQNNEQLKVFLDEYGYKLEEMCLAAQVLKTNRNPASHPCDSSINVKDIEDSIYRLYPTTTEPKRLMAEKALTVLEISANKLGEPLFLKLD